MLGMFSWRDFLSSAASSAAAAGALAQTRGAATAGSGWYGVSIAPAFSRRPFDAWAAAAFR
jgi:hypothetical protein